MDKGPLHWSERAKMYPTSFSAGGSTSPQPDRDGRDRRPRRGPPKEHQSRKGFLIVLLILLVCAAAAAVIFLWYLPSRDSSGVDPELEARNLVRQAMLTIDEAYDVTGTYAPDTMDPTSLTALSPEITFSPAPDTSAATSPTALAQNGAVDYAGTVSSYAVGTVSANGIAYGVLVDTADVRMVTFYLDGQAVEDWQQPASSDATSPSDAQTVGTIDETDSGSPSTTAPVTGAVGLAEDVEAMTLVRDSMITVESAYAEIGTFEPSQLTAALLQEKQPSITFVVRDGDQAALDPISNAAEMSLDFYGTLTNYFLGVRSVSGTTFGVIVEQGASGRAVTYYVNGQADDWSTQLVAPVVGRITPLWG